MIRITSGKYRGRNIESPNSKLTHPMGAREKLALFNMITGELDGARVLDAYAGSGALGIEALSRGAKEVVFVEKDAKICRIIRDNLAKLGVSSEVICGNVVDFTTSDLFDVIIADPPYDRFSEAEITPLIDLLKQGGTLVLSHPDMAPDIPGLNLKSSKKYANAHISVYVKR